MLKICFYLLTFFASQIAFAQTTGKFSTDYHIEVRFTDVADQEAMLAYYLGSKQYVADTVDINGQGVATFTDNGTDTLYHGIYLIYLPKQNKYFEFLFTEPKVVLQTSIENPVKDMNVIQSEENKLFIKYLNFLSEARIRAENLRSQLENSSSTDSVAITQKLSAIDVEVQNYISGFIEQHKGTFAAKTVKANQQIEIPNPPENLSTTDEKRQFQYEYYYEHYWDNTDLTDDRIILSPWFEQRIDTYLNKLTIQHPDSLIKTAERVIALTNGNKYVKRYVVQYITNQYASSKLMTAESVYVYMVNNYYTKEKAWWIDDNTLYKMQRRANALEPLLIGKKLPNFILESPQGKLVNLQNELGKYSVLFFYDPTCGHCKKDAPKMEEVRQSLADMGVAFWGVALDIENSKEGIDKWKQFIEEKGLEKWQNVADLQGNYALLARYDIRSTPMVYVIDKEGEIILKRIGADQLGKVLEDVIERNK